MSEEDRRKAILTRAAALGITHKRLAEVAGLEGNAGQVRMHRWTRGEARLSEEQLAAMEAFVASPVAAADDADGSGALSEEAVAAVVTELARLAGEIPEEERDGDVMRYLARKHAPSIFGQAIRLMTGAKSESVRADMVRFLKETGFGKAVAVFEDRTPKPPMEDDEFIDVIRRMIDAERARRAQAGLPVPEIPEDPKPAEMSGEGDGKQQLPH